MSYGSANSHKLNEMPFRERPYRYRDAFIRSQTSVKYSGVAVKRTSPHVQYTPVKRAHYAPYYMFNVVAIGITAREVTSWTKTGSDRAIVWVLARAFYSIYGLDKYLYMYGNNISLLNMLIWLRTTYIIPGVAQNTSIAVAVPFIIRFS